MSSTSCITVLRGDDALVVRMQGEIDAVLRDQADRALAEVSTGGSPVVVDLAGVDLLGATGLTFLVQCRTACARAGVGCALRHVPARVVRLLAVLGLDDVLEAAGDRCAASGVRARAGAGGRSEA